LKIPSLPGVYKSEPMALIEGITGIGRQQTSLDDLGRSIREILLFSR
jgi:hypothetical protein